jgi:glycosyltransferase involved in cell wall biosynthesis
MELEPVLLSKIQKPYDVVIVGGLYPIMNFRTMRTIYEKLKCQIHFFGGDYVFMTGGCHFTGDCLRYMTGCGKCPGIYSNDANDFTAFNAKYIKSVYEQTKPVFWCNTYMKSYFADKSYLLSGYDRIESVFLVIKMGTFKPMDRLPLLKKYGVPSDKRFVMLFGCNTLTDERKGVSYLKKALNTLYNRLSEEERKEVLFLTIGHDPEELVKAIPFDNQHLGFVPMKSLPEVYNLASVFLCPSVNDAGPSMVNQSLACGVPVIAFEMGTALDLVKDKGTGYCARLRDADDYADGIAKFMHMPQSEFEDCKRRCRSLAQEMTSEEAFSKRFKEMWEKYK